MSQLTEAGVREAGLPDELRERAQWVVWRAVERSRRLTKVPYDPKTKRNARVDDPRTWASFAHALCVFRSGGFDGVGFVLTAEDPYAGLDLDNALAADGTVKGWAQKILALFPSGGFVEISPSGRGIHVIGRGKKPGGRCKFSVGDGAVEIYEQRRYLTMTGNLLQGSAAKVVEVQEVLEAIHSRLSPPSGNETPRPRSTDSAVSVTDSTILAKAFASKHGDRIRALWDGNTAGYDSHSEADLALCSHLLYWADGDMARVDALFRKSGLMREKWKRADYQKATLVKAAFGQRPRQSRSQAAPRTLGDPPTRERSEPYPIDHRDTPELDNTHRANAWRTATRYGYELRYAPGLGHFVYDGKRWVSSETRALSLAARVSTTICEEAAEFSRQASLAEDPDNRRMLEVKAERLLRWARASEQGPAIRESLKLTAPLLELDPRRLDAQPLLLNVQNGTLDLQEGVLRSHDPADLLTKMAPVWHNTAADAPNWHAFINEILSNESLVRYVQKALGYSTTGMVQEQCLFFAFGEGQNGKSTLLNALKETLGDGYVTKAAPDLLLMSNRDHPSEIADLRGARLVIAQEVMDGRVFDTQRLKELTGERWLKARKMYGEWFEFPVTFKLWLAANHRPKVPDNTMAFWRRIRLIPFTRTIANPVPNFGERLAAERSGILNWLQEGVRLYLEEGLEMPPEVSGAITEYRLESDSFGQFLVECCELGDGLEVKATELWKAYEAYAAERGLQRIRKRDLKMEMLNRGYHQPPRRAEGFFYSGVALKLQ